MNEERYILFDQYLQGEMTVEERDSFEQHLSHDYELALEFDTFKEVQSHLKNKFEQEEEREAFKENLTAISGKHFNNGKAKVVLMRPWYFAAAASVIILFGLFFFDYNQNPNFGDFNHPETASFVERGDTNATLKEAEKIFNERKYTEAIPLFEEILKDKNTPEIQYFYGISLLEINKFPKAESVFKELISGNSVYKEKAKWNLALSKLKQKKYAECKQVLQTISQDYENYDDVQELLDELD